MRHPACLLAAIAACVLALGEAKAMVFRPEKGAMWDPSILWHDGKFHAFMMYNKDGDNGLNARHCLLATSTDGVHWRDEGPVNEERESAAGNKFFKCFVGRCGDRFIMDHGVARRSGQDVLRFYESQDLRTWSYLFSNSPDPRWYGLPPRPNRWDHMYILPKEEGNPTAGYWGYVVAVPKAGTPPGVGMMESADGRAWTVLPPAPIQWPPGCPTRDHFEYGGCERIGGKYYLIGGTGNFHGSRGYAMFTLVADNPRGPFRPDLDAFRLCGSSSENVAWLAAWCRGNKELLISNYASMKPGDMAPWLLPLRKPVVNGRGRLQLAWWTGNEAIKGQLLPLKETSIEVAAKNSPDGYAISYLPVLFDSAGGIVLEGTLRGRSSPGTTSGGQVHPSVGLFLDEGGDRATAILLGIGPPERREAQVGRLRLTPGGRGDQRFAATDVTGKGCATATGVDDGRPCAFRLISRRGLFELYVDDMLAQTYYYRPGPGRVGIVARDAQAVFSDLKAWRMSLTISPSGDVGIGTKP